MENETIAIICGTLFAVSESLSLIPAVKANGIFQLVFNILKKSVEIFKKKPEGPTV